MPAQIATTIFELKTQAHRNWFDENHKTTSAGKEQGLFWLSEWSIICHKEKQVQKVQRELWEMQDEWWQRKVEQVEWYADMHATREFFGATKSAYVPSNQDAPPYCHLMGGAWPKTKKDWKSTGLNTFLTYSKGYPQLIMISYSRFLSSHLKCLSPVSF